MTKHGSHGPSGLDTNESRPMLTHFGQQSVELTKTLAKIAQKISTEVMSLLNHIMPVDYFHLIKTVRPIVIGEVIRKIIGKTITQGLKSELMVLGSNYQLCFGQKCGIEYATNTLRKQYEKSESDAILLIDVENAFNYLNRNLALENLANICPSLLPAIQNSYYNPPKLFVNENFILSREGIAQGDTLAMAR